MVWDNLENLDYMSKKDELLVIKLLKFLKNNDIILVNAEEIGEVKLPLVDEAFILENFIPDDWND
jgi:hypothetical protein